VSVVVAWPGRSRCGCGGVLSGADHPEGVEVLYGCEAQRRWSAACATPLGEALDGVVLGTIHVGRTKSRRRWGEPSKSGLWRGNLAGIRSSGVVDDPLRGVELGRLWRRAVDLGGFDRGGGAGRGSAKERRGDA